MPVVLRTSQASLDLVEIALRLAVRFVICTPVSPHPGPLPWGEGETEPTLGRSQKYLICQGVQKLFLLPEGEGQDEGENDIAFRQAAFETSGVAKFEVIRVLHDARDIPAQFD